MACTVTLGMVTTIYVTPDIKIGFSFLASELAYLLFGPVVGMFYGGAADILKYFVKPVGPFFPGYTLDAMLSGLIYGMFLYKKPIKLWRIAVARAVVVVFVNTLLAAYWRHVTGGNAYSVLLTTMGTKNLIMFPINTAMFYLTVKALQATNVLSAIKQKVSA